MTVFDVGSSLSYLHLLLVSTQNRCFWNTKSKSIFNMALFEGGSRCQNKTCSHCNGISLLNLFVEKWQRKWRRVGPDQCSAARTRYWNILTDSMFCTGISLLTEYFVLAYPCLPTILYWHILAYQIFCTGISLLTEYFVLEYPY
jgi:hypothetical protein